METVEMEEEWKQNLKKAQGIEGTIRFWFKLV